jgi:hypothetical protein
MLNVRFLLSRYTPDSVKKVFPRGYFLNEKHSQPAVRSTALDPLRNVVRPLACPELDDAKVGEPVLVKRVFSNDGFDLLPALADRQDDPAVSRYFPGGNEKIAGGVVLLQEPDVRARCC